MGFHKHPLVRLGSDQDTNIAMKWEGVIHLHFEKQKELLIMFKQWVVLLIFISKRN